MVGLQRVSHPRRRGDRTQCQYRLVCTTTCELWVNAPASSRHPALLTQPCLKPQCYQPQPRVHRMPSWVLAPRGPVPEIETIAASPSLHVTNPIVHVETWGKSDAAIWHVCHE